MKVYSPPRLKKVFPPGEDIVTAIQIFAIAVIIIGCVAWEAMK